MTIVVKTPAVSEFGVSPGGRASDVSEALRRRITAQREE